MAEPNATGDFARSKPPDIEDVYQAIGEFVVFFQAVEDMYRSLGWQIVDPARTVWPPIQFRKETNADLIDKVTELFIKLASDPALPNGTEKAQIARELQVAFHALRKFRNRLLHSAFSEVVGGGQVVDILRIGPRLSFDLETGEAIPDQESFDPNAVRTVIARHSKAFFQLHSLRLQVIHWPAHHGGTVAAAPGLPPGN